MIRQAALADPAGFVDYQDMMVIDEIQRVPELLLPIKVQVDNDARPGRYLLSGSLLAGPHGVDPGPDAVDDGGVGGECAGSLVEGVKVDESSSDESDGEVEVRPPPSCRVNLLDISLHECHKVHNAIYGAKGIGLRPPGRGDDRGSCE